MANIGAAMRASDTEVIAIDTEKCVHQPKRMSPADKTRYDTSSQLANATMMAPRVSNLTPAMAIANAIRAHMGKTAKEIESKDYPI